MCGTRWSARCGVRRGAAVWMSMALTGRCRPSRTLSTSRRGTLAARPAVRSSADTSWAGTAVADACRTGSGVAGTGCWGTPAVAGRVAGCGRWWRAGWSCRIPAGAGRAEPVQRQQCGRGGVTGAAPMPRRRSRRSRLVVEDPAQPHRSRTAPPGPREERDGDVGAFAGAEAVADPYRRRRLTCSRRRLQVSGVVQLGVCTVAAAAAAAAQDHGALLVHAGHRGPAGIRE